MVTRDLDSDWINVGTYRVQVIDRNHVALAGISDGAGYALSMGLAYGNTFNHVIVFSGGLMIPFRREGKPRLFFAHGLDDMQMPIDRTARRFVAQLKGEAYDVTYHEYQGGHRVPPDEMRAASNKSSMR